MFVVPLPLVRGASSNAWPSEFAPSNVVASRAALLARRSFELVLRAVSGDDATALDDIMASTASALPARLCISRRAARQVAHAPTYCRRAVLTRIVGAGAATAAWPRVAGRAERNVWL